MESQRIDDLFFLSADGTNLAHVLGGNFAWERTHLATDCGCITWGYSCDDCAFPPTMSCTAVVTQTVCL